MNKNGIICTVRGTKEDLRLLHNKSHAQGISMNQFMLNAVRNSDTGAIWAKAGRVFGLLIKRHQKCYLSFENNKFKYHLPNYIEAVTIQTIQDMTVRDLADEISRRYQVKIN